MIGNAVATQMAPVRDGRWWRLGQVGAVEIRAHPTWFATFAAAGLAMAAVIRAVPGASPRECVLVGIAFTLALAASCIAHEVGHALAGACVGRQPLAVVFFGLGAATVYGREAECPSEKALTAAAGPGANVVAALPALAVALALPSPDGQLIALSLGVLSIAYALVNLFPAYPHDGGQLLHALLWWLLGSKLMALRLAGAVGLGLACVTLAASVLIGMQLFLPSGLLLAGHGAILALSSARLVAPAWGAPSAARLRPHLAAQHIGGREHLGHLLQPQQKPFPVGPRAGLAEVDHSAANPVSGDA
mgnify:CR=1 FL=1